MKKLLSEFKTFINRGSVMDLAVGMIIGSAFTAIINSLVKNILTPLINWIPGAGDTGALQTVLREAVTDAEGNIVTEALILDWGSVISAIVTFFLTAVVLFLIVKAFNKIKDAGSKVKEELKNAVKKEEEVKADAAETAAEAEAAKEEAPLIPDTPETERLLREIVELLKAQNSQNQ